MALPLPFLLQFIPRLAVFGVVLSTWLVAGPSDLVELTLELEEADEADDNADDLDGVDDANGALLTFDGVDDDEQVDDPEEVLDTVDKVDTGLIVDVRPLKELNPLSL